VEKDDIWTKNLNSSLRNGYFGALIFHELEFFDHHLQNSINALFFSYFNAYKKASNCFQGKTVFACEALQKTEGMILKKKGPSINIHEILM